MEISREVFYECPKYKANFKFQHPKHTVNLMNEQRIHYLRNHDMLGNTTVKGSLEGVVLKLEVELSKQQIEIFNHSVVAVQCIRVGRSGLPRVIQFTAVTQ